MTILGFDEGKSLKHYGILRKSGRYPWGSGANPAQRSQSFFETVASLRTQGFSDVDIAKAFSTDAHPFTTTDLRIVNSIARNQKKASDIASAQRLKDKGMSNVEIGKRMGINESSVRSLLAPGQREKTDILLATSNMVRDQVERKGIIDIGKGVENSIGVSKERLATAVSILKAEGYVQHTVQVDQVGTGAGNKTSIKVLAKPGTTYRDIVANQNYPFNIKSIGEFSEDGGRSFFGLKPPVSVSSSRLKVAYKEDGGDKLDGVIYVRPGKDDLSLGGSRYAQVRIMVDKSHYIKGMAMYKDDLPDGVDLVFNTNKSKSELGSSKLAALKKLKDDPDNPFGAVVDQLGPRDAAGHLIKATSAMNLVNKEGSWDKWKSSISSQVLSKQSPRLAKTQLDMTYERSKSELDAIMSLTNPTVKRKLLESYADGADSSSVHLKAAALPRQRSQVILPVNGLKENEIYAPNFRNGERVALIRYPHGGTFEIPELVVNNNHRESRSLLGMAQDAVGINHKVAERLSGADFDGDSVLVVPNPVTNPKLKTSPALEGLRNFDPQSAFPPYDGMRTIDGGTYRAATKDVDYGGKSPSSRTKGTQMGLVSNLITDMTIKGASTTELAAAVRHSMVVIDAEKHKLNYKESARVNGIPALMKKYQPRPDGRGTGGAATLISRATSRTDVPARSPRSAAKGGPIDPITGRRVYEETGESWTNRQGKTIYKTQRSTKLAETDDAHSLSSGTPIERVYADHSNRMKALANTARRESLKTPSLVYSPAANKAYKKEVDSLTAKLDLALRNAPRERQAQVLANHIVKTKRDASPDMDAIQLKKIKSQALDEARRRMGAGKQRIEITPDEWAAIQAGAVSNTRLKSILDNADMDKVKELATPRTKITMSGANLMRAKSMASSGYTQAEIADALGVSLTTIKEGLKEDG